jgi:hypothetical protein
MRQVVSKIQLFKNLIFFPKNEKVLFRSIIGCKSFYRQKLQVLQINSSMGHSTHPGLSVRTTQLHWEVNLPIIIPARCCTEFFENAAIHPNPLVPEYVDYDENTPLGIIRI